MIRAFLRFYFSPTLVNWRTLRRLCMVRLPQSPAKPKKEVANV